MNTRTSKLIFPAILFLFACLIAFGENGPTPKIVVGSSGISDGSVTNAKLAEPVSVANGGTGKTTAAEALAALGGASLNGSSTVAFNASTINGVVPLTAAEKTQALVGSSTVDFQAQNITLRSITTADSNNNLVFGSSPFDATSTNKDNTVMGIGAMKPTTSATAGDGSYNVAIGGSALSSNTTGKQNVAVGFRVLRYNTSGPQNTAIGYTALQLNTTGSGNTAIGVDTLGVNTTGVYNTAMCVGALGANTTGTRNVAIGRSALANIKTTDYNTAIGFEAGKLISDGQVASATSNSVFVGNDARPLNANDTNTIVIGSESRGAGSNSVVIGNTSITYSVLRGVLNAADTPAHADNAAAKTAGLVAGDIYRTGDVLKIVHDD